jgi:hypothetical protein
VDFTRGAAEAVDYLQGLGRDCRISATTALELIAGRPQPAGSGGPMKTHGKSAGLRTLDAVIAATALEEGLTLVTKNRKHFQMIGDLKLEVPGY